MKVKLAVVDVGGGKTEHEIQTEDGYSLNCSEKKELIKRVNEYEEMEHTHVDDYETIIKLSKENKKLSEQNRELVQLLIGKKYRDEENFIWEVKLNEDKTDIVFECEDLIAREDREVFMSRKFEGVE